MKYVDNLLPVLDDLIKKHQFTLMIISDLPPDFQRPYLQFIKWNKETEIEDLLKFNVGVEKIITEITLYSQPGVVSRAQADNSGQYPDQTGGDGHSFRCS